MEVEDPSGAKVFKCLQCDATSKLFHNIKRHMKKQHQIVYGNVKKGDTYCQHPGCHEKFYHKTKMFAHMQEKHGFNIKTESHSFSSRDEFLRWKCETEKRDNARFTKQTSKGCRAIEIFFCERDGSGKAHVRKGEPDRLTSRRNKKGRLKTGHVCPAKMHVQTRGDGIELKYTTTHNHPLIASPDEPTTEIAAITGSKRKYTKRKTKTTTSTTETTLFNKNQTVQINTDHQYISTDIPTTVTESQSVAQPSNALESVSMEIPHVETSGDIYLGETTMDLSPNVSIIHSQLESIKELIVRPSVHKLLLPHITEVLDGIISNCKRLSEPEETEWINLLCPKLQLISGIGGSSY